jgi:hypothetical protein
MRFASLSCLLAVLGTFLVASTLVAEEVELFNGKDLDGWVWRGKTPDDENPFYVKDGVLRCKGRPIGYLHTKDKYTNYVLKLEWRWPEDAKPGNNGVLLRSQGGEHFFDNTWPKSLEAQLQNQRAGDIFTIGEFPLETGRNNGRYTPMMHPTNEKPQGQWNEYEITMKGGQLKLVVNGLLQNQGTDAAIMPGYIGLQSEGAPIEYRNIRITPLDD